jgi:hypothetical protein
VLQDRLTNAEIATFYIDDMVNVILKHPKRAIVGGTGKFKRGVQNIQGLLLDVDRQFGVNMVGWAGNKASAMTEDFVSGTISGQEMDPEVQKRLGLFLKDFDPINATLEQAEYIISYNLVAMRQRGTRVSTNAAIDRQAKRLGLTSARTTDGIVSALRKASGEANIIKRDLTRRLETDFNKVRPILTEPGDIVSSNPLVTDPRKRSAAGAPSGQLDQLGPDQGPAAPPTKRFVIENGKLVN